MTPILLRYILLLLGSYITACSSFVIQSKRSNPNHLYLEDDFNLDDLDMDVFRSRRDAASSKITPEAPFDGYAMRDLIFTKWGECYDVDFNKVDTLGFRQIFLNIFPFKMGGRWRHESELDYLMHLQAVVEILEKYGQLDNVIYQIQATDKVPKMGAPIKAVPIKLDLNEDEVNKIMGR